MKKRIFSMLLCLCMVLMLLPATALAEEPGSLTVTVSGFEVGKTPNDCTYTFESTIPGVTFSADDIQSFSWLKYSFDKEWNTMYETEVFEAGARYRIGISLNNKGLELAPVYAGGRGAVCGCRAVFAAPLSHLCDG